MISILCEYCDYYGIEYESLDGSVNYEDRQNRIDRFNKNPNVLVFVISTKAGGIGINLTSATNIIIYDSDWNPQNDIQAISRAHRIGQKKSVTVYRLITSNTY
jgi:SNF2 family DNA or RNA helicase